MEIKHRQGAYPLKASEATSSTEDVLKKPMVENHRRFTERGQFPAPPGHALVHAHIDKGFGLLFDSRVSAERFPGSAIPTAPPRMRLQTQG